MSNRISGLFVALERDISEDDIRPLIDAIKHLRGVAGVKKHVMDPAEYIAQVRVRAELTGKMWKVLFEDTP